MPPTINSICSNIPIEIAKGGTNATIPTNPDAFAQQEYKSRKVREAEVEAAK